MNNTTYWCMGAPPKYWLQSLSSRQNREFCEPFKVVKHHRTQIYQQISLKPKERHPYKTHVNKNRNRCMKCYSSSKFFSHREVIQELRKLPGKSSDPCDLVLIVRWDLLLYLSQMYIMHEHKIVPGQYLGRKKRKQLMILCQLYSHTAQNARKIHESLPLFFPYPHT